MIGRRILPTALVIVLALVHATTGVAYWKAGGTGSGQASVDTLGAGNQPTAAAAATTVTVQWTQTAFRGSPLGGFASSGYTIRRYPAAGGAATTPSGACGALVSGTAATLSCQETSVPPGSWRYTVTPLLGASWTGAESPTSTAVGVAPGAPTLSSVTAQNPATGQSTGDIQVSWGTVTGATGFNVYRRTTAGSYDFSTPLNGTTPLTGTTYTDTGSGLTGATTYAYVVRAVTDTVEGASSNELTASAIARPSAPTGLSATLRAAARIDVGWSTVAGAVGYNVYRRTSAGSYDYASPLNGTSLVSASPYADTTATDGTTYRYVVRAVISGAGGARVESVESAETPAATADGTAPSTATLTDPGSPLRGSVALAATAVDSGSGVASVRFQYTTAGGSTWTDGCTATAAPYSCSLVTTGLTDGLYDLRAVATDVAGNTKTSSVVASRRIDNTAPTAGMSDPGAYLRAAVTLTATGSDGGSGLASVRIQRAATGSGVWTDVCTGSSSPTNCTWTTTAVTDGGYDLRAIATDAAGNATTSTVVSNRVVDNTAPTGVDVQTTNVSGGTAGKPQAGDVVTYTFSEPMLPASILSGWTGASTSVTVRFTNGNPDVLTVYNAANNTLLPLGSLTSGTKYVSGNTTFTASSMLLSGNSIVVTLGTPGGGTATANTATTLQWTTSTAATDRAGNPLVAATVLETGTLDLDF
jgi:hypothetical protein